MGPMNPEGTLSGGCLKIETSVREEGSSNRCEQERGLLWAFQEGCVTSQVSRSDCWGALAPRKHSGDREDCSLSRGRLKPGKDQGKGPSGEGGKHLDLIVQAEEHSDLIVQAEEGCM